jgi:hypothetical protein
MGGVGARTALSFELEFMESPNNRAMVAIGFHLFIFLILQNSEEWNDGSGFWVFYF